MHKITLNSILLLNPCLVLIASTDMHGPSESELNIIKRQFGHWTIVTKQMFQSNTLNNYPKASGFLGNINKGSIFLLHKTQNKNIDYLIVHLSKDGKVTILFKDSWPTGNPLPYISTNEASSFVDIKTQKSWAINAKNSFIFDEWAYKWVFACVNGKWEKILIQSEE